MITLFGIDESGNSIYTYQAGGGRQPPAHLQNDNLADHLKIATEILDKRHDIHYVAIVQQSGYLYPGLNTVSFDVQLLHLARRSSLGSQSIEDRSEQDAPEIQQTNNVHNSADASEDDTPGFDAEPDSL